MHSTYTCGLLVCGSAVRKGRNSLPHSWTYHISFPAVASSVRSGFVLYLAIILYGTGVRREPLKQPLDDRACAVKAGLTHSSPVSRPRRGTRAHRHVVERYGCMASENWLVQLWILMGKGTCMYIYVGWVKNGIKNKKAA